MFKSVCTIRAAWLLITVTVALANDAIAQRVRPTGDPAIAFEARATSGIDIIVMTENGSNPVDIIGAAGGDSSENRMPTWSPDGSKIAFASNRDGKGIYIANADGTGICKLVSLVNDFTQVEALRPSWSPKPLSDGKYKIAYQFDGTSGDTDLYMVDATCPPPGSTWTAVNVSNTPSVSETHPTWSPNAYRMAATAWDGAGWDVRIFDVGTAQNNFQLALSQQSTVFHPDTGDPLVVDNADWSRGSYDPEPGGVPMITLALHAFWGDGTIPSDLFLWHSNSPAESLTNTPEYRDLQPSWSPDDSKIVYLGADWDGRGSAVTGIYTVNVSTGVRTRLLRTGSRTKFYEAQYPDWRRCDRLAGNGVPNCNGTAGVP